MPLWRIERIENKQDMIADDIWESPQKARRFQRLQDRQERIANRQIKKGNLTPEEFAEIDQNREIAKELKDIQHEVIDKKLEGIENSVEIQNLMNDIDELQKQLPFIKRGESPEEKAILNRYNACLKACERILRKNNAYSRKLWRGRFNEDIRRTEDMVAMLSQMRALLDNAKSTASKVLTGQYKSGGIVNSNSWWTTNPGGNNNYSSVENYSSRQESLRNWGIIGGLNHLWAQTNMTVGQRQAFSTVAGFWVTAFLLYGWYKVATDLWGVVRWTKSLWFGDKDKEWTPWLTGLGLWTLATTTTLWKRPREVVKEVAKWWDSSRKIHDWFAGFMSNPTVSADNKEAIWHSMNINTAIGLIPFSDLKNSGILSFPHGKPEISKAKLKEYINSDHAKENYTDEDLENMKTWLKNYDEKSIEKAFEQMGITEEEINNNPDKLLSSYFIAYSEKFSKKAEEVEKEESEYNGKDAAKIKPQLAAIESQLNSSQKESFHNLDLEKALNILYQQHPKARPISLWYEDGKLSLNTYGHKSTIDALNSAISVYSPYSSTPWESDTIQEAVNIANLINFTTTTYSGSSDFDGPFNLSYDGTEQDIEFSKTGGRTAGFSGLDITILGDTWLNNFDTNFPSINNNKQAFVARMNDFKIWNKNNPEFQEVRTLEEKLKNDYGINATVDVEKGLRKFSGLIKSLWIQRSEWLSSKEYKEALVELDQALSKFPQKLLQKTKLDSLVLWKNADFNWKAEGIANWATRKLPWRSVDIEIDAKTDTWVNHLVAHEYVHNLIYKNQNTSPIDKRQKLSEWASVKDLNKSGSITPYGMSSPEEDVCEIAGVLFNWWSVSSEYQARLSEHSNWSGNLFERIKTDPVLLKKVEVFTGCKINANSSTPFVRKLTLAERQGYWFDKPAFFSERSRDAGQDIDENYRNNLKTI